MSAVKKSTVTSICIALCCVLPLAFHALGLGAAFSPLHIPVLLCGLVCGPGYGLFCGVAGPVLSSLISSMPSAVQLIYMLPELAAYGGAAGLFYRLIRTGKPLPDIWLALVPAMLAGRLVGGLARAAFQLYQHETYSLALWAGAYFTASLPGIAVQLALLPAMILILTRAGLIPRRYPKEATP